MQSFVVFFIFSIFISNISFSSAQNNPDDSPPRPSSNVRRCLFPEPLNPEKEAWMRTALATLEKRLAETKTPAKKPQNIHQKD